MIRVLVLGARGMLGAMIATVLASNNELRVVTSTRHGGDGVVAFDAERDSVQDLVEEARCDWIVNAVGLLNSGIEAGDQDSIASAIDVNAAFPHRLVAAAGPARSVIHVSTDGVFSGQGAPYDEGATCDAESVYARSKALGEVRSANAVTLRCSIIGPETPPARSLLGRALSELPGATIAGYVNHRWNGVTTLHLAKLCAALILSRPPGLPRLLHVVPGDSVTKFELLQLILTAFGRSDVAVAPVAAPVAVDRTLRTTYPEVNRHLWSAAGYAILPSVAEMVGELVGFAP